MSSVQKIKFLLRIKIYLVPDLENTIVRVLVTNVSHLYEQKNRGGLNHRKGHCGIHSLCRGKWSIGT